MSTLPCDRHGALVRGKLLGLYPSLYRDKTRFSSYRRLCWDCMHQTMADHHNEWKDSEFRDTDKPDTECASCHKPADNGSELCRLYVTAYVDSKTRRDYQAYYCDECAELLKDEFKLHVRA